jgi:hypothetical protein
MITQTIFAAPMVRQPFAPQTIEVIPVSFNLPTECAHPFSFEFEFKIPCPSIHSTESTTAPVRITQPVVTPVERDVSE